MQIIYSYLDNDSSDKANYLLDSPASETISQQSHQVPSPHPDVTVSICNLYSYPFTKYHRANMSYTASLTKYIADLWKNKI